MATVPSTPEIKEFLRNEKPTEDDPFISDAILGAVDFLNDECQRVFTIAPTPAEIADYLTDSWVPDPCSDLLFIGDCIAVSAVVENGVTLTVGTHYQLEPVRRRNFAGIVEPYTKLRRLDGYWYRNGPRATVAVTRAVGWSDIPPRVVESIKILSKFIVENRDVSLGLAFVSESGGISPRDSSFVKATIEKMMTVQAIGIA